MFMVFKKWRRLVALMIVMLLGVSFVIYKQNRIYVERYKEEIINRNGP